MRRGRPRHDDILTPREWEVLELLREDLTNEQIATRLGVSLNTVKYHLSEIYSKLGTDSRRQAAAWHGAPRGVLGVAPIFALLLKLKAVSPLKAAGVSAIGTAGVAFAALMLGVVLGQTSPSAGPTGKLEYVLEGNIWVVDLPDGTPEQLTDDEAYDTMLAWSPSGNWLLFVRNEVPGGQRAHVITADGSEERALSALVAYWSPVEDQLAYLRSGSEDLGALILENADGSDVRELVPPVSMATGLLTRAAQESSNWSPDGRWLAFVEIWREAGQAPDAGQQPLQVQPVLLRVPVDGGDVEEVFRPAATAAQVQSGGWTRDNAYHLLLTRPKPSQAGAPEWGPLLVESGDAAGTGQYIRGAPHVRPACGSTIAGRHALRRG